MKAWILRIVYLPQSVRFSTFFASFMVALALVGLYLDWSLKNATASFKERVRSWFSPV